MKWRAVKLKDGQIDQSVIASDTHTVVKVYETRFIAWKKGNPVSKIIGIFNTAKAAKEACEAA